VTAQHRTVFANIGADIEGDISGMYEPRNGREICVVKTPVDELKQLRSLARINRESHMMIVFQNKRGSLNRSKTLPFLPSTL
jgi:hypothetical protein